MLSLLLRQLRLIVATVVATLAFASTAASGATVRLVWSGTSGAGTPGSDFIEAAPGDTLFLDVVVDFDVTGLGIASVGLQWDTGTAFALSAEECPSPPNLAPGLCSSSNNPGIFYVPLNAGVAIGATSMSSFDIAKPPPFAFVPDSMTIGRATFEVTGSGTIDTLYIPGFDGLGDGIGSPIVTPAASATILVPEPGVAGLLLGALSALVAVRRRRS